MGLLYWLHSSFSWYTHPPTKMRCDFAGHARMPAKMVRAVTWKMMGDWDCSCSTTCLFSQNSIYVVKPMINIPQSSPQMNRINRWYGCHFSHSQMDRFCHCFNHITLLQFNIAVENGPVEMTWLFPSKMVDLSIVFCTSHWITIEFH